MLRFTLLHLLGRQVGKRLLLTHLFMSRRPVPSLPGDWKEQHRTARHAAKNVCREAAETISRLGTARITIPEEILAKWGNVPTGEDVSVFAKPETMTEAQKMSAPTLASAYDTFSALGKCSSSPRLLP